MPLLWTLYVLDLYLEYLGQGSRKRRREKEKDPKRLHVSLYTEPLCQVNPTNYYKYLFPSFILSEITGLQISGSQGTQIKKLQRRVSRFADPERGTAIFCFLYMR